MKVSLNWLKDYVKIPEDMDLKQLAFDLTMSTVEVEGVTELARSFDGIVVGEIREVQPHPPKYFCIAGFLPTPSITTSFK